MFAVLMFLVGAVLAALLVGIIVFIGSLMPFVMKALDTIVVAILVWTLTHVHFELHPVFVILSIIVSVVAWFKLSEIKVGEIEFRPVAFIGSLLSAAAMFWLINNILLTWQWFGANVSANFDFIWQVTAGTIVTAAFVCTRFSVQIQRVRDKARLAKQKCKRERELARVRSEIL